MRYAKIKNGKVVDVIQGIAPSDYTIIIKDWSKPRDFPGLFYTTDSNVPIITIEDGDAHENWTFTLKDVDSVKMVTYKKQKEVRYKKQLGSFVVDGETVTLVDRNDARDIANLNAINGNYKTKNGKWVKSNKISNLKAATEDYVQAAYDWEMAQNELVEAMTTHDELKVYFDSM